MKSNFSSGWIFEVIFQYHGFKTVLKPSRRNTRLLKSLTIPRPLMFNRRLLTYFPKLMFELIFESCSLILIKVKDVCNTENLILFFKKSYVYDTNRV